MAARSSSDLACWRRATSRARCNRFPLPPAAASSAAGARRPGGDRFPLPTSASSCCSTRVWASASAWRPSSVALDGHRPLPAGCKNMGRSALRRWLDRQRSPGAPRPSPPHHGPAWPAPIHASSFPGRQEWKSMFGCKRHSSLCLLIYCLHLPAELRTLAATLRMRQNT